MARDGWLSNAREALASARLNLKHGLIRSAVDRAYYVMFHSAKAALAKLDPVQARSVKTHATVIGQFGLQLCQSGLIDRQLGRWINSAHDLRNQADYESDAESIDASQADEVVGHAAIFLERIERFLGH